MSLEGKRVLILEGGGFKTSYTAGILDAFTMTNYFEFDAIVAVSGGSLAASYYLSGQFGSYFNSMRTIVKDPRFISFSKAFSEGLMNLDFFYDIAEKEFPFDFEKAVNKMKLCHFYIVLTDSESGETVYVQPNRLNWIDLTIAASTVPMLTKGRHSFEGKEYSDGGISNPIPIEWTVEQNPSSVLLIRTTHHNFTPSFIKPEYFVAKLIRASEHIKSQVENFQINIKKAIDFVDTYNGSTIIEQLAPEKDLKTNIFTNSVESIVLDYRNGLDDGLKFVFQKRNSSQD